MEERDCVWRISRECAKEWSQKIEIMRERDREKEQEWGRERLREKKQDRKKEWGQCEKNLLVYEVDEPSKISIKT